MANAKDFTAFTDCSSETVVIRIPYEFCASLMMAVPESEEKQILMTKLLRCRSNKLKNLLEKIIDNKD